MQIRDLSLSLSKILRFVTVGLLFLTLAAWALPFFTYSGVTAKEVKATVSLWSFLGFTEDYPQIAALLDIKYVNIATLKVPIIMIVTGVGGIVAGLLKKGIGTAILPLIFSVYGFIGFLSDEFLSLINHTSSYMIQVILLALSIIVVLASIVFNIIEMKTRPDDYYLEKLGV